MAHARKCEPNNARSFTLSIFGAIHELTHRERQNRSPVSFSLTYFQICGCICSLSQLLALQHPCRRWACNNLCYLCINMSVCARHSISYILHKFLAAELLYTIFTPISFLLLLLSYKFIPLSFSFQLLLSLTFGFRRQHSIESKQKINLTSILKTLDDAGCVFIGFRPFMGGTRSIFFFPNGLRTFSMLITVDVFWY